MPLASITKKAEARASNWSAIVGAPRCGTTSLSRYLQKHPQVRFSDVKETHFFSMRDLSGLSDDELAELVQEEYLDWFYPGTPPGALRMEGSVSYLYAPERLLPALKMWPDAKFIVAVRNPLQMLPSVHQRHLFNGDETVRDFGRAWALVEERRRGKRIPRGCIDPRLLDYKEIGQLGKYV